MTLQVEIYDDTTATWINYTKNAVLPFKTANLLDEQLDEAELTLKYCLKEYFQPLTLVKTTRINTPKGKFSNGYYNKIQARKQQNVSYTFSGGKITETQIDYYIVASDNANQVMGLKTKSGSAVFNHQLYLIELTKIAEGFIGDTLTFTNALGNDYIGG